MDLRLDGRIVVVTGGSSGLGRSLALRLAEEGAKVAVCGRDAGRLDAAVAAITAAGRDRANVLGVAADVTRVDDLERLVTMVLERWGRIDGLVNNAGMMRAGPFDATTDAEWHEDLELKLHAAARAIRLVLPGMRQQRSGVILNVLNIGAKAPTAGSTPTTVSRAAGLALTKALANEMGPYGIRVNAICVGLVESGQWERISQARGVPVEKLHEQFAEDARIPLGRVGRGGEFADLAAYLLSDRSSYVTGVAINLDGGSSPVP